MSDQLDRRTGQIHRICTSCKRALPLTSTNFEKTNQYYRRVCRKCRIVQRANRKSYTDAKHDRKVYARAYHAALRRLSKMYRHEFEMLLSTELEREGYGRVSQRKRKPT